jgi:hypothetical protein
MSIIWSYTRNGVLYAEVRSSERKEGVNVPKSIPLYLGKVIDLEKGLFKNKKWGVFKYTIDSGVEKTDLQDPTLVSIYRNEKTILDFGASYLLTEFAKIAGFWELFRETLPNREDSLMAMVFYYVEMSTSNQEAVRWLRGSFSSLLFPVAQLQSQRISELLEKLGDEAVVRSFFSRYLKTQLSQDKKTGILIDSTGLPNAIHFPLTAVSNHNGEVSEEVRLIFVVDTKTGLPLFFRYNAGNIVDIKTLKATLAELAENGVSVKHAIVDAGYCSEENIEALCEAKIHFLTRLPANRKLYVDAISKYKENVLSDQCRHMYQDRVIGIRRIYTSFYGHRGYLYLCVDYNNRNEQIKKFTKSAIADKLPRRKWSSHTNKMGFFALVSSEKIKPEDLLPLYYTRQTVEQVFDVSKNNTHILPLRTHNEETFRGHIMLTFMAIILHLKLNQCFKGHKVFTAQNALIEMRNLKCKVYDDCILVKEITKDMREVCKMVGIKVPEKISLPINHNVVGK